MSIRNVQNDSAAQVNDLMKQLDTFQGKSEQKSVKSDSSPIVSMPDPGQAQRLAGQFARSRVSLGSSIRQQQLAGLLSTSAKNSPETLNRSIAQISNAAKQTDGIRQARTENSLATAQQIVNNGTREERDMVGRPINQTSDAVASNPTLDTLNKILDTFTQIIDLMKSMIQALRQGQQTSEPAPAPTPQPDQGRTEPTPVPSQPTPTTPTPAPGGNTSPNNEIATARERLTQIGFAGSTMRQITDSAAVKMAKLNDNLLGELARGGADNERAFARKIDGLPQDAFAKLAALPEADQTRIAKLSSQQILTELSKATPAPVPTPTPTPTPTPAPGADIAAARERLTQIGFAGSTMRQITDSSAVRMAGLNDNLLRELAAGNADNERAFARKMDALPQDTFDKLKALEPGEQSRIAKLAGDQIIEEIKKKTPAPTPTPTPTPTPGGDVAAARERLTQIGFAGSTMRQITDSAAVKMAKLNDGLLGELAAGNADNERAFARKIDGLPQDAFDKLAGLGAADQTRIAKLSSQQILEELKKLNGPTPTPTPVPTPGPTPTPTPNPGKAAAFSNAVDVILGRKPATEAEKAAATEVLKQDLVTKELNNTRSRRTDPTLLNDKFPKDKELVVGANGDKKVFWNAYDNLHFLARHTSEHFDTADIKAKNGFWPAGTSIQDINRYLETIATTYGKQIELPRAGSTGPGFKYFEFELPENKDIRVSVGIQSDGRITSFFALSGPGVTNFSGDEARKLLGAIGKA